MRKPTSTRHQSAVKASRRRLVAGKETIDATLPRYLQIARQLKRGIADGSYPVGAQLPTELELCEQFKISRFTARGAVRVLSAAGLVTRRQRVGTIVVATPDDARFSQGSASLRDLLQYAQDTELRLFYVGRVALSKAQTREFGADTGTEWIYALGIRYQGAVDTALKGKSDRPLCLTRIFLNPMLKGIEAQLRERNTAIYALIEREYEIPIERVEQDLQGVLLDADDAANLGAIAGSPALRIVRRYYSGSGQLLEVAENLHPGDRFTYHMQLRK